MNISKKQVTLILIIIGIAALGYGIYVYLKPAGSANPSPPPLENTAEEGHYRNEEYGFEFDYPDGWELHENLLGRNTYAKFNIFITPSLKEQYPRPILVNVVLPEFPEKSFRNIEKTTTYIIVDGVEGQKYEYEYEGHKERAVILPLNENTSLILANGEEKYVNEFNQFLDSFKFIE